MKNNAILGSTEISNISLATLLLRLSAVVVVFVTVPVRHKLPLWMAEWFYQITYPLFFYNFAFLFFYKKLSIFLQKHPSVLFIDLSIAVGILQIGGGWRSSYFVYTLTSIMLFTIFNGRKGAYISAIILATAAIIKDPSGRLPSLEIFDVTNWDMRLGAALFYITAGMILGYFSILLKRLETLSKAKMEETSKWAAAEEKRRLALELHDSAKQMILAILLTLNPLVKKAVSSKDKMSEELEKIWRWMNYLQRELSRIVESLKTEGPTEKTIYNLKTIAEEEVKIIGGMTGFIWYISSKHSVILISPESQEHIRKFFSESLMNAWKHSGVTSGTIDLDCLNNIITITVIDKGKGFNYSDNEHFKTMGIKSLKYRAEALKGELTIETAPGKGCKIILTFPVSNL